MNKLLDTHISVIEGFAIKCHDRLMRDVANDLCKHPNINGVVQHLVVSSLPDNYLIDEYIELVASRIRFPDGLVLTYTGKGVVRHPGDLLPRPILRFVIEPKKVAEARENLLDKDVAAQMSQHSQTVPIISGKKMSPLQRNETVTFNLVRDSIGFVWCHVDSNLKKNYNTQK